MSRLTEWTIYCNGFDDGEGCGMNVSSFESEADLFAKAERDGWEIHSNGIDYCSRCKADPRKRQ